MIVMRDYFGFSQIIVLKGVYTPNLKLACFVCYLKIINIFFLCEK